ncbi:enoyl-CoA hydratase/isomerase family protein [Virgibacillus byunsanensis]|uniref:Enoyl-CoA hydratase/isomerase family protein n=1 Tax=Virgibacillus byunsanensis TaxID=570945 RepID=A0ABW3LQS7_9BACI
MSGLVEVKVNNKIGHIMLNRPDKLNALSRELVEEIIHYLEEYSRNPDVNVIIISGNGKSFCAGGSIDTMQNISGASEAAKWVEYVSGLSQKIMDVDKYVIAAVHGYAAGAGFSIALASDFIVADTDAKFALSFTNIGLIPDLGLIKTLTERVSSPIVKEWISSGKTLTANEAESHMLVNRIVKGNVISESEKFADFVVNGPMIANKYVKYLVNNVPNFHQETAFMQENIIQVMMLQTEDHKEGISAFFEKRIPEFTGR